MAIAVELALIPFFKDIPKDIIQKMSHAFTIKNFTPSEIIISFGESVDALYLIVEGSVDIWTFDKKEIIASLNFGAAIGEVTLFKVENAASAHVIAGTEGATLLKMPKKEIEIKILSDTTLSSYFYKGMCAVLAERLSHTNQVVANKIADLKHKLAQLLEDHHLLRKIRNTQHSVEELGVQIFSSLAAVSSILEKQSGVDRQSLDFLEKVKNSVEKVLLQDLQNIDRIAQKLGLAIQYLENLEKVINNQSLSQIQGDEALFRDEEIVLKP